MEPPSFAEFLVRVAIMGAVLGVLALVDWRRRREQATRWQEYAFLMLCGVAGGVFGICVDAFTASGSPEYFWLGKGIPDDDRFWPQVFALGFQAGFVAGAIIGGLLLVANSMNRRLPALPVGRLCRLVPWIMLAAVSGATAACLFVPQWDPLELKEQMSRTLTPDELRRFLRVWSVHFGLYCGGAVGTAAACFGVVRNRRSKSGDTRT